ncbi:MAG: hypothetical protein ACXVQJ_11745 [Actinomycetota bacterium]
MIRYPRGALVGVEPWGAVVRTPDGDVAAIAPVPVGALAPGTEVVLATTRIEVGVEVRDEVVLLGRWPLEAPDPGGPRGLALVPVVVLPDGRDTEVARAGALRAGGVPTILILPGDAPALGLQFLVAVHEGVDVLLVEGGGGPAALTARLLGGRPLVVPPLDDPSALSSFLQDVDVDVHVPVPSLDPPARDEVRDVLGPLGLVERHQVLEVDAAPAFAQLGAPAEHATLGQRAAGAAGVLAGRLAAANRRWRAATED